MVGVGIIDEVAQHSKKPFEMIQRDIMREWKQPKQRTENLASVHIVEQKVTLSALAQSWRGIA